MRRRIAQHQPGAAPVPDTEPICSGPSSAASLAIAGARSAVIHPKSHPASGLSLSSRNPRHDLIQVGCVGSRACLRQWGAGEAYRDDGGYRYGLVHPTSYGQKTFCAVETTQVPSARLTSLPIAVTSSTTCM